MSEKPETQSQKAEADQRAKRRSEQLRANLMRRKAQIRSRRSGSTDERGEGLPAANVRHDNEKISDESSERETDSD